MTRGILSQALNPFQGNEFPLYHGGLTKGGCTSCGGAIGGIFPFSAKMLPGNCRNALNFVSLTFLQLALEMQAGVPD